MSDPLIGQTLGHYKIVDQLGAGGMGVVYRAQDLKLGRQVALKVLPAGSGSDDEAVERFRREARTASSLNHPNICTIYGFDEQNDQLYLAMELLDGDPLDRKLSGKPLDIRVALDIATQVADALDAAHGGGILHRDIKPANIFLTRRGPVKVLDFGLAKLAPEYRRPGHHGPDAAGIPAHFSSVAGTTVGTIAYMSPEQARGEDVDPRTDLFSFGVVIYELVTGKQSFPGHTTAVVFDGILNREPAPASTINPLVPPELDRIISKALEKERELRYQTAADLGADLKRLKRDSASRPSMPTAAAMQSLPDAATVVMPSGAAPPVLADTMTASQFVRASSPTGEVSSAPAPTTIGSGARTHSSVTVPGTKTGWMVGVGAAVVVVAVIAGIIGARMAGPSGASGAEGAPITTTPAAATTAAPPAANPTAASPAATNPPALSTPKPAALSAPKPAAPAPPATTAAIGPPGAKPVDKKAAAPPKPAAPPAAPAPPPVVSREAEATQRLDVARAKIANNLNDQALADLRQIILDYPGSRASAEAAFLAGELHEKTGRADDAMAAYVEFESRFKGDVRAADSKLRRAMILSRQGRNPRAQLQSRELLSEVARDYPSTPQAAAALSGKLKFEQNRDREFREIDPVLKVQVPSEMVTLRMIIEQFPNSPQTMVALNRLAVMLVDMDKYADAAQTLETLGERYPGNPANVWFRLGDLYERRLSNPAKAKATYAKVPQDSASYSEAQKRMNRIK